MRFRAAVLNRPQEALRIAEVDLASLGPDDVLIRNHASGLCHTDLEVIEGTQRRPFPIILGHEGAGVVEDVGSGVKSVRPGDHVIASWNPHCGHCFYCDDGQPVLCEPFTRHQPAGHLLDGGSRLSLDGAKLHHFGMVSSHAEYSVVPSSGAIAVPREIPFDRACLIGCGVMTGVGAAVRMAKVKRGSSVAVAGCGAVGLNAIQGARISGAETIVAIDRDPARLARAGDFGATQCILSVAGPGADPAIDAVRSLTGGRGADYVFESAGSESAMRLALEITRPAGDLVILGKTEPDRMVAFRFGALAGEKRIVRSSYGGARPARDFPWLAELYLRGELLLDELITIRLPLADINAGFDAMRRNEIVRAVVQP
jgi:S-(hydroxymethyl)glutathione dehydrogenase / alcohol dehydrogenase